MPISDWSSDVCSSDLTLSHDRTITAQDTANCAHIGNRHFAKTVMLKVDGDLAMMVMPAAYRIDLTRLSRALGGREVELAQETEFSDAFPDCELRSEEHTSELQSLMRISYAVFCLKKKNTTITLYT